MKFITEDDLRRMYRESPFAEYPYQEGRRLTPGGRQFLLDRGVKIGERRVSSPKTTGSGELPPKTAASRETDPDRIRMKLTVRTMRAGLLQAGADLLEINVLLAQELFAMEQELAKLQKDGNGPETPDIRPCTGLKPENFRHNMGSCFEINGFHAQTEKGREIIKLHYLRCLFQEQEPWLSGHCREGINCMINRLSQMICRELGGTVCQRKQQHLNRATS